MASFQSFIVFPLRGRVVIPEHPATRRSGFGGFQSTKFCKVSKASHFGYFCRQFQGDFGPVQIGNLVGKAVGLGTQSLELGT